MIRRYARRLARRALVGVLLAMMAAAFGMPSDAASSAYVQVTGRGAHGERVSIVWGPDGGDVTTTNPDGLVERIWFDGAQADRQDMFGAVYEGRANDIAAVQADRVFLSGAFMRWQPRSVTGSRAGARREFYVEPGSRQMGPHRFGPDAVAFWVYYDAAGNPSSYSGPSSVDLFGVRFEGDHAVQWRASDGMGFTRTDGPVAVAGLPPRPRSTWDRQGLGYGAITASVAGRPARALVATGTAGLSIAPAFARAVGAIPIAPGLVRLRDVVVAGKRVSWVPAILNPAQRYDVQLGIGLFPRTGLLVHRDGKAETTPRKCANGVSFDMWEGLVVLPGDGARRALLDTAHDGSIGDTGYLLATMKIPTVHPLSGAFDRLRSCTARPIEVRFGGRRFGSDYACSNSFAVPRASRWSMVVGLHSMDANALLIDLSDGRVCWS